MNRLLLVEDDAIIGQAASLWLKESQQVDWVRTLSEAQSALKRNTYDLVLLDIGLPDGSGFDLLPFISRRKLDCGVIVMTAYGESDHRVRGLDGGADDYIVKPLDFKELDARIRAVLRRKQGVSSPIIDHGTLSLDTVGRVVNNNGKRVALSQMEVSILSILLTGRGRYYSRRMLEEKLYDDPEQEGNAVEVHISALRKKLGKDLIKTTRGLGYIIEPLSGKTDF
ncbi:MAG: response regulator transcription factor [Granulosicoccus sp.]|nr:response regulator transcription factor [Granulosicoccus sp.]